jgi:hypothetical protein
MPNLLETQHPLNPAEWEAESLRLTAFLSPSAQIDQHDWWKTIVGDLPERTTSERSTGIQQEEGKFGDGKLSLIVQPTRIDWQLTPLDVSPSSPLGFPKVGPWLDSLRSFHDLMLSWIEIAPPVQRLAFGAVFLLQVPNSQEGYKKLSDYLPFELDKDSTDFFYQINRPRKSTSIKQFDLKINRLSKWNVLGGFALSLNQPLQIKPTQFSLRLELDLSTAEDFQNELPSEQLPQILSELVEVGKEIALKGDIK